MWEILGIEPSKDKEIIKEALRKCLLEDDVDRERVFQAYQQAMEEAMIPDTQEVMNRLYRVQDINQQTIQEWMRDFELVCRYDASLNMDRIYEQFIAFYWISVDPSVLQTIVLSRLQMLQVSLPHYALYFRNMEKAVQAIYEKQMIASSKYTNFESPHIQKLKRKHTLFKIGKIVNAVLVVWGIFALILVIASYTQRKPDFFVKSVRIDDFNTIKEIEENPSNTTVEVDEMISYFVDEDQIEKILFETQGKEKVLQTFRDLDLKWQDDTRVCISEGLDYENCESAQILGIPEIFYTILLEDQDAFGVFLDKQHPATQYFMTDSYYQDILDMVRSGASYVNNASLQGFQVSEHDYVLALESYENDDFELWFVDHLEAIFNDTIDNITPNV